MTNSANPDFFNTPSGLAMAVAKAIPREQLGTVADYAVGDGSLLQAVAAVAPKARLIGVDIDSSTIRRLRARRPKWRLAVCDFLSSRGRARIESLRERPTAIVLNPPFSGRGAARCRSAWLSPDLSGSRAAIFVASALSQLSPAGVLIAIVPESVLVAEKDAPVREWLEQHSSLEVLERQERAFAGASVRTAIVRVTRGGGEAGSWTLSPRKGTLRARLITACLIRGSRAVFRTHAVTRGGSAFLHTTSLSSLAKPATWQALPRIRADNGRHSAGPGVLLPRVGVPLPGQVRVIAPGEYVLSDCVLLIKTTSQQDARELTNRIHSSFQDLQGAYLGTGARFITMSRLREYFCRIRVTLE